MAQQSSSQTQLTCNTSAWCCCDKDKEPRHSGQRPGDGAQARDHDPQKEGRRMGAELLNTGPLAKAGSGSLCGVVRRCLSAWAGGCPHLADQENEARKRKSFTESE